MRVMGLIWEAGSAEEILSFYDRLDSMRGLDENGGNVDKAQVSGTITVDALLGSQYQEMLERYPNIQIQYTTLTAYLYYYNDTGTKLLYTETITNGGNGQYETSPSKASTAQYSYSFTGWSKTPGGTVDADARKAVAFDRNVYAVFKATLRKYTVRFYNENTLLQTVKNVPYGTAVAYTGDTPVKKNVVEPSLYPFKRWEPSPDQIMGDTDCYAQFDSPMELKEIEDDWDAIIANIQNGSYAEKYNLGNYKPLNLGKEGIVNMQLVAKNDDTLADGSGTVATTWIAIELLKTAVYMNSAYDSATKTGGSIGGWEESRLRKYLQDTIKPLIPENVRNSIKTVQKYFTGFNSSLERFEGMCNDELWIPSVREACYDRNRISKPEQNGPRYYVIFSSFEKSVKYYNGHANFYYLRTAYSVDDIYAVSPTNTSHQPYVDACPSEMSSEYMPRIALGFCI